MNAIKQLITIWEYSTYPNFKYHINETKLPKIWQVILTSDGSFTRNISIVHNIHVQIDIIKEQKKSLEEKYNIDLINDKKENLKRRVWLNNRNNKIVFAQSSWQKKKTRLPLFSKKIPIGKNLINSEINIHRELQTIYLCYSTRLEQHFQCNGPLWGRSYKICFENKSAITIHEIFSTNNQEFIPLKK